MRPLGAQPDETIAAVSSPPGRSLRGLIRITGSDTRGVMRSLLGDAVPESRTLTPARLLLEDDLPLPVLACFFAAPASYTGMDMLEVQAPGHPALLERILARVLAQGARLAQPGEFTFLAFCHGKLDLTRAEGISATITAVSDSQLAAASLLRHGELGQMAQAWVDRLANALALVEAGIDFTDQDDVVPISPGQLLTQLGGLVQELQQLLRRSRAWGSLDALPQVVFTGLPSAGKSTLFNRLLGHERAVTSAMPGTTRDVLREALTLTVPGQRPIEVMLLDIAGLDDAAGALDAQVQSAARAAVREADLLLHVVDPHSDEAGFDLLSVLDDASRAPSQQRPILHVWTKADLPGAAPPPGDTIAVSSVTGQGLDTLRERMYEVVAKREHVMQGELLALQPRHEQTLRSARQALSDAVAQLQPQADEHGIAHVELIAGRMREALDDLAALGGHMTPDDVIGRVFATFCVGK